jgi:hypothetical protein
MGPQSCKNPNSKNFKTPTWESRDKMTFRCWSCGQAQSILWGGRWWLPPSLGYGEFCGSMFARGSYKHQRCSNYALTNLLFGLCRFVWIIELLVNLPSPHSGPPARPSTLEVLRAREHAPTFSPFVVFTFGLVVSPSRSLGVRQTFT